MRGGKVKQGQRSIKVFIWKGRLGDSNEEFVGMVKEELAIGMEVIIDLTHVRGRDVVSADMLVEVNGLCPRSRPLRLAASLETQEVIRHMSKGTNFRFSPSIGEAIDQ